MRTQAAVLTRAPPVSGSRPRILSKFKSKLNNSRIMNYFRNKNPFTSEKIGTRSLVNAIASFYFRRSERNLEKVKKVAEATIHGERRAEAVRDICISVPKADVDEDANLRTIYHSLKKEDKLVMPAMVLSTVAAFSAFCLAVGASISSLIIVSAVTLAGQFTGYTLLAKHISKKEARNMVDDITDYFKVHIQKGDYL